MQFIWYIFKIKVHCTKKGMYWKIFHIGYQPANDWWAWPVPASINILQHSERVLVGTIVCACVPQTCWSIVRCLEPVPCSPQRWTGLGTSTGCSVPQLPTAQRQEHCWRSGKLITAILELPCKLIPHITSHELLPLCPYTSPPLPTARLPWAEASPSWQQHRQQGECWEWQPQ